MGEKMLDHYGLISGCFVLAVSTPQRSKASLRTTWQKNGRPPFNKYRRGGPVKTSVLFYMGTRSALFSVRGNVTINCFLYPIGALEKAFSDQVAEAQEAHRRKIGETNELMVRLSAKISA